MDWVKLSTSFYNDAAVMRAGEAAEVLFVRAMAYCGDQENAGIVPKEALPRLCPTRGIPRARALVREGLWEVVEGGWRFVNWHRHQETREQLDARRVAGRARQARHRQQRKSGVSNAVTNSVSDAEVTGTEVEVEVDAAAAAGAGRATTLPASVEILRAALEAHKLVVRWDLLTLDQVTQIEALITTHGDGPLVKSALSQYQPNRPPATAQAWIGGWEQLRKPGDLAAVQPDPCAEPGHSGTTRHCAQCASERLATGS
ncbi:hypothetical protein [Nocardioides sp.]|uniref:hypothetical protein n=1 Tax=Nocardioides sp. TaxID=35761 RepID=UPI00356784A3